MSQKKRRQTLTVGAQARKRQANDAAYIASPIARTLRIFRQPSSLYKHIVNGPPARPKC
ncbi:hypothetical protein D1872_128990 [compost metagenome]